MDHAELKRMIIERIDTDNHFADQLGRSIEAGLWEVVASLIAKAINFVIDKASDLWKWLTTECFS